MPADEQERLLRANNDSVIKLNHVVHHGGLGHHIQNWNAFRAESRIGKVAGVDVEQRTWKGMVHATASLMGWIDYMGPEVDRVGEFLARVTRTRG